MTLVALENDGKRITKGGRAGLFCTAALIGSLAVQAWVIVAAGLGSEPAPEQVATFFEEYRFGLSIVGLLVIVAVAFFLMLLRGLYYWLGGSGLTGLALVTGSLGAASMTVFAVGVAVGRRAPPEWIISNATDLSLGLAFIVWGAAMLQHQHRPGWLSVVMGILLAIAGLSPAADPHLAQLFLIVWSTVFGLQLLRLVKQATE